MNLSHKITIQIVLPVCCILFAGCDQNSGKSSAPESSKSFEFPGLNKLSAIKEMFVTENGQIDVEKPAFGDSSLTENSVTNGMKKSDVLSALGVPKGEMVTGNRTMLIYNGGHVELLNGFVTNLEPGFIEGVRTARENAARQAAFETKQKAKGLVLFEGKWIKSDEKERLAAEKRKLEQEEEERLVAQKMDLKQQEIHRREALEQKYRAIAVRDEAGNPIDHSEYITTGKITILDFYASWCEPCRQLSLPLDELSKSDSDITLKKVDIVNWGSQTAKKYNVRSVPNIRVFDRQGWLVGPPTSSIEVIKKYIEDAKNRK
jgi:thiol-disulfide isomerase/thioredoxin